MSYLQDAKLIHQTRKLISKDMGIISKIENKMALKNIDEIIKSTDSVMIARGDLAIDVGHSEVPKIQLGLIKNAISIPNQLLLPLKCLKV